MLSWPGEEQHQVASPPSSAMNREEHGTEWEQQNTDTSSHWRQVCAVLQVSSKCYPTQTSPHEQHKQVIWNKMNYLSRMRHRLHPSPANTLISLLTKFSLLNIQVYYRAGWGRTLQEALCTPCPADFQQAPQVSLHGQRPVSSKATPQPVSQLLVPAWQRDHSNSQKENKDTGGDFQST